MTAMFRIAAMSAAALALAACQQAAEPENVVVADNGDAGLNYVAEVMALNEPQQRAVMLRAIRDAGIACQNVTEAVIQPDTDQATWRATCEDGASHLIVMQPNGDANVVSAGAAARTR